MWDPTTYPNVKTIKQLGQALSKTGGVWRYFAGSAYIDYLTDAGYMTKAEQDSSYDGWDVNKVFVPYAAMRRDFPDKPPGTPETFDQLLVVQVAQVEFGFRLSCHARSPGAPGARERAVGLESDGKWHVPAAVVT